MDTSHDKAIHDLIGAELRDNLDEDLELDTLIPDSPNQPEFPSTVLRP